MSDSIFKNVSDQLYGTDTLTVDISLECLPLDKLINTEERRKTATSAFLLLSDALVSLEGEQDAVSLDSTKGAIDCIVSQMELPEQEESLEEDKPEGIFKRIWKSLVEFIKSAIKRVSDFFQTAFTKSRWKKSDAIMSTFANHVTDLKGGASDYVPKFRRKKVSTESFFEQTPSLEKAESQDHSGWVEISQEVYWTYPKSMGRLLSSFKSNKKGSTARLAELTTMIIEQDKLLMMTTKQLSKLPSTSTARAVEETLETYKDPSPIMMQSISLAEFEEANRFISSVIDKKLLKRISENAEYNMRKLKEYSAKFYAEGSHATKLGIDTNEGISRYQKTFRDAITLALHLIKVSGKYLNAVFDMAAADARTF